MESGRCYTPTKRLGKASEPTNAGEAESAIHATVDRSRICIWLAMSIKITVSTLLVAMA